MRLIILATGPFAVPMFEALLNSAHEVAALVTRPTPPVHGRGPAPRNPMREAAEARGVPVFAPDSINDEAARRELATLRPDLLVVCDYGQILKSETLAVAPLGGINLHGSLLPKYRGAAPVQWAVWNGEMETGVTVIHMTPKLDGGPILTLCKTCIGSDETAAELEPRLAQLGVERVFEAIRMLTHWDRTSDIGSKQDPALASLAPRLKKSDGAVVWTRSGAAIRNQIRAFQPWPGSFTFWRRPHGEPLRLILEKVSVSDSPKPAAEPGIVLRVTGDSIEVATGGGALTLDQIQPAGKRVMSAAEFLRGHPVAAGEKFGAMDKD